MSKLIRFIDRFFWLIIILSITVTILFFKISNSFNNFYQWFKDISYTNNSNLVTISTVFIGIYFSLYTFLTSANVDSFLTNFSLKDFKKLIRMINHGFLSSFSIVLLSFVNKIIFSLLNEWYIYFLFIVFVALFGSAIQIALYYTLIFKNDLDYKFNSLQKQKEESQMDSELRKKLKRYLDSQ
ncbi:hypothetical protein AB3329_06250 [Streptococcus sp. H31]|uniref:hypothetical protein n=1 Tax=Streptococcus huangxiaojuni TaxID=3237239 RepID=UPI0034A2015F